MWAAFCLLLVSAQVGAEFSALMQAYHREMQEGRGWRELAQKFLELARRHPRSDLADDALLQAAYILYAFCRGEGFRPLPRKPSPNLLRNPSFEAVLAETEPPKATHEALKILRQLIERYPDGDKFDDALYWTGRILLTEFHDLKGAKECFEELRRKCPRSEWLSFAELLLKRMEEFAKGPPLYWRFSTSGGAKATAKVDCSVAHSGNCSLLLHNETPRKPHVYGTLWQRVKVKPNTAYRLRLWVRARNARHCWFGGGPKWRFRIKIPDGTYDWRLLEAVYRTGPDETWFDFRINVDGVTEALWVDDAEMVEAKGEG